MSNRVAVGKCINRLKKEKKKHSASHPAVLSREEMGDGSEPIWEGTWWLADVSQGRQWVEGQGVMSTMCESTLRPGGHAAALGGHPSSSTNAAPQLLYPIFWLRSEYQELPVALGLGFLSTDQTWVRKRWSWSVFLKSTCSCLDPKLVRSYWY